MEIRVQRIESMLKTVDPHRIRIRMPMWSIENRLAELAKLPDAYDRILTREPLSIGKTILLGYYTAMADLECGEDAEAVAASLQQSGALESDDPMPLLIWCAGHCRSDPV